MSSKCSVFVLSSCLSKVLYVLAVSISRSVSHEPHIFSIELFVITMALLMTLLVGHFQGGGSWYASGT